MTLASNVDVALHHWFRRISGLSAPLRLLLFLLTLALFWLPFLLLGSWAIADPNVRSITTLVFLYLQFIWLVRRWGWIVHGEPEVLGALGLWGRCRFFLEQGIGVWLGTALVFVMFSLEAVLGWATWQGPGPGFGKIALEGCLMSLAIGFAEELLFRGWMWDEVRRDYGFQATLWGAAIAFALLHFLKPWEEILRTWPQFFGLVLLGVILNQAKVLFRGRLGLPMGLHSGLVWGYYLVNVGQLSQVTKQVPAWVTGVDGNPLAGLVGLGFLVCVAIALQYLLTLQTQQSPVGSNRHSTR